MNPKTKPVGDQFLRYKEQLRLFYQRPTDMGGVVLVTGTRGTGKTRLVDEALNDCPEPPNKHDLFPLLLGDNPTRKRVEVTRHPRDLKRYLIKVDVSPYFPHASIINNSAENSQSFSTDPVFDLLRNVVFALTSTIDSRYSLRDHGKTLRARLGFWRYWFAFNALTFPATSPFPRRAWFIFGIFSLIWLLFGIISLDLYSAEILNTLALILLIVNPVLSWMLLRWWDWRALQRISAKLYDQVHAAQAKSTRTRQSEKKTEWTTKLPWIVLLISSFAALWQWNEVDDTRSVATEKSMIITQRLNQNTPPSSILAKPGVDYKNTLSEKIESHQANNTTNGNSTTNDSNMSVLNLFLKNTNYNLNTLNFIKLILGGTLISFAASRLLKSSREDTAQFDQTKLTWMITLLRRYLFICHRCGLEPVLVVDELDKLDEREWQTIFPITAVKPSTSTKDDPASNATDNAKLAFPAKDQLEIFLLAFTQLKANLGAEFLWTFIGGYGLAVRLQEERQSWRNGLLGPYATVFHQHVVVEPITLEAVVDYLQELQSPILKNKSDVENYLWLISHGNMAELVKICTSLTSEQFNNLANTLNAAKKIADINKGLWKPNRQKRHFGQQQAGRSVENWLAQEWVQVWLHVGMMELAYRILIMDNSESTTYRYYRDNFIETVEQLLGPTSLVIEEQFRALMSGNPELLRRLGEWLLYRELLVQEAIKPVPSYDEDAESITQIGLL